MAQGQTGESKTVAVGSDTVLTLLKSLCLNTKQYDSDSLPRVELHLHCLSPCVLQAISFRFFTKSCIALTLLKSLCLTLN
jgi:hypothetical protein